MRPTLMDMKRGARVFTWTFYAGKSGFIFTKLQEFQKLKACLDGAEVRASGLKIGRSRFKFHPRLTSQS